VHTEDDYRQFIFTVFTEETGRKRHQTYQHKEHGVDVGEHMIHVFRINGNEEMMRSPISEEKSKAEQVA